MSYHTCKAHGCRRAVPHTRLMCEIHWRRVPSAIRAQVTAAYKRGQPVEKQSRQWREAAAAAVKWLREADGRLMPIDTPLDAGIRPIVELLRLHGYDTFASCEGGPGHAFDCPTVLIKPAAYDGMAAEIDRLAEMLAREGHGGYYLKAVYAYQGDPWPVRPLCYIELAFWTDKPTNAQMWQARAEALQAIAQAAGELIGPVRLTTMNGRVSVGLAQYERVEAALAAYKKLSEGAIE